MCYVIIEIAQLVCRDLGCGYAASATQASLFGEGAGPIWKPIIECVSVISYEHCMITTMQTTSCNHSEDAGVICSDILNIRLANGANNCSGRVEFYYKDQWEAGCGDYWDMQHAQVVCRELGCGYAVSASVGARSGNRTAPYWRKGYHCSGEEQSLISCSVKELTTCHKEASVICSDDLLDFISSSTFSTIRCVFIICYLLVMSTAVIIERVLLWTRSQPVPALSLSRSHRLLSALGPLTESCQLLVALTESCQLLVALTESCQLLVALTESCQLLVALTESCQLLVALTDSCQLLVALTDSCQLLVALTDSCQLLVALTDLSAPGRSHRPVSSWSLSQSPVSSWSLSQTPVSSWSPSQTPVSSWSLSQTPVSSWSLSQTPVCSCSCTVCQVVTHCHFHFISSFHSPLSLSQIALQLTPLLFL
ncbi:UNVERIFIED_CONTAM: hypothetical protein FKN15_012629 [Acipenser sinensis]